MNQRILSSMILALVLMGVLSSTSILAEISVGVKEGDWIEYIVMYTGTSPENYQTGIKIEVLRVQGTSVTFEATLTYSNGTQEAPTMTVDLGAGALGEGFIIPANLNTGDTLGEYLTISGVEERAYIGVRRAVVYLTILQITFFWDQKSGVLVEANMSFTDHTVTIKADKTNMWQPNLFGLEPPIFFAIILGVIGVGIGITILVIRKKRDTGINQDFVNSRT